MSPQRSVTRRRLVGASGSIALLGLAGCLDDLTGGGGDGNGDENGSDGNETDGNETDGNGSNDDAVFESTILWVNVTDEETGDPVGGVTVTVTNDDFEAEVATEANGRAFFRDVEAGEYTATAETEAGSDEATVELEEGDDGEVDLEVPIPEEDEGEGGDGNETDGNETDGNETDGNETDGGNETDSGNETDE